MGGSVPTFGAWALGRWQPPGRFHDVQLHRGQVHYFLAELYHGGGSKGLGKRFLHETLFKHTHKLEIFFSQVNACQMAFIAG